MPTKTFTQFRADNVVTTLPTTLNYGEEVYYKDSNGNLTLWVGHEDGTAWPVVGYKEIEFSIATTSPYAITIQRSDIPTPSELSYNGGDVVQIYSELIASYRPFLAPLFSILGGGLIVSKMEIIGGGPFLGGVSITNITNPGSGAQLAGAVFRVRWYPS